MIRPLAAHDLLPLRELLTATASFNPAEIAIAEELVDTVLNRPEQRDYYAFVYVVEDHAVGFIIIGPVPATVGTWHMYWIAVHPAQHGAGAGPALAAFAESFVRHRGGYWIIVETSSQRAYARARRFYAKQGYTELLRIPDYYRPGDDLVMLGRRLTPVEERPIPTER